MQNKNLPFIEGIYCIKDSTGSYIYIGKSKDFKDRLRQHLHRKSRLGKYIVKNYPHSYLWTVDLYSKEEFTNITDGEIELIKKYLPKFNDIHNENKRLVHTLNLPQNTNMSEATTRAKINRLIYLLDSKAYEAVREELFLWREELTPPVETYSTAKTAEVTEVKRVGKITYQWEKIRCGKNCKGCPHGPYLYAYWKESGKTKSKYIKQAEARKLHSEELEKALPGAELEQWYKQVQDFKESIEKWLKSKGK